MMLHVLLAVSAAAGTTAPRAASADWLVSSPSTPSVVRAWSSPDAVPAFAAVELRNGLLSRAFSTKPNWATVDYRSFLDQPDGESLLRAISPEARVTLACFGGGGGDAVSSSNSSSSSSSMQTQTLTYDVGGLLGTGAPGGHDNFLNRTVLASGSAVANASAFAYTSHRTEPPPAPYAWSPGARNSPPDAAWPPRGVVLVASFAAPAAEAARVPGLASVVVEVRYLLYEGLPLLSKWVTVHAGPNAPQAARARCVPVAAQSEVLALNPPWSPTPFLAYAGNVPDPGSKPDFRGAGKLHVEVTQQYGTRVAFTDETIRAPPLGPSSGSSRRGSAAARMMAALGATPGQGGAGAGGSSPLGGTSDIGAVEPVLTVGQALSYAAGRNGSIDSTAVLELVLDDGPEGGAPIASYPASESLGGCTLGPCRLGDGAPAEGGFTARAALARRRMWRVLAPQIQEAPVFMHLTNCTPAGIAAAADQCGEAGFDMIILSFGSGFDIESADPAYLASIKASVAYANARGVEVGGYDLIGWTRDPGAINASWSCVDPTTGKNTGNAFWGTGWSTWLQERILAFKDATGLSMVELDGPYAGYECASADPDGDPGTVDAQFRNAARFFGALSSAGIFINAPDFWFAQGTHKEGVGYNENTFSLPRDMQNVIVRANLYDGTRLQPNTAVWSFVPLVDYHGGGGPAAFEPMSAHLAAYGTALANAFGTGVATCWRGFRLWDDAASKALVLKWTGFYRAHRALLNAEIVHMVRPDGQGVDGFVHVLPSSQGGGGCTDVCAMVLAYNPTAAPRNATLRVPLYFGGVAPGAAVICAQEGDAKALQQQLYHQQQQQQQQQQHGAAPLAQFAVTADTRSRVELTVSVPAHSATWLTCVAASPPAAAGSVIT